MTDAVLESLRRAVAAAPDDVPLRMHLAELLVTSGHGDEAVPHLAAVLQRDPGVEAARRLMTLALGLPPAGAPPTGAPRGAEPPGAEPPGAEPPGAEPPGAEPPGAEPPGADVAASSPAGSEPSGGFDWRAAEQELGDAVQPMFVGPDGVAEERGPAPVDAWDVERTTVRLADVGGMVDVKDRLEAAFLAPMRNPELRRMYAKSLRGGLLLYGPPGCGKTFLAKAVAGELSAGFISVTLADVLDMYIGNSERNLVEVFALARRSAPCVLFLDEIDALGQKRSQTRMSSMRTTVNQLLSELDGVSADNEGVFVLAATNHPWDVDVALRRPGRLDRTVLVLPPDEPARAAILAYHLRDRPVEGVNLQKLARSTDGYSGADLAHVAETAAERVMLEAARTGDVRHIRHDDLEAALREVHPSTGPWFETARNVALFANENGAYDELLRYLKKRRLA